MPANVSNNRLVVPHKEPKKDTEHATNWQNLERWANEHVVNQLVPGENVTMEAQTQTLTANGQTPPNTGIVTVNASGSGGTTYASLTGPGETVTPGALTQAGPFTVDTPSTGDIALNQTSTGSYVRINGTTGEVDVNANTPSGSFLVLTESGVGITCGTDMVLQAGDQLTIASGTGGMLLETTAPSTDIEINATGSVLLHNMSSFGTVTIQSALGRLGFYGVTGVVQPTVSGSRGGNAALASLLTALADLGLIIDSSTA